MANREGFQAFYEREVVALTGFAYRLTGNWGEAEDLAQDAMVRTYRAWDRIQTKDRPDVYARAVVVNRHRSLLRRALVEAKHLVTRAAVDQTIPDPADRAIWDELGALPPRQRAALVLHYYEDLPQTEIARILGCAEGTVNSLVHRGLARLRERLQPVPEDRLIPRSDSL